MRVVWDKDCNNWQSTMKHIDNLPAQKCHIMNSNKKKHILPLKCKQANLPFVDYGIE